MGSKESKDNLYQDRGERVHEHQTSHRPRCAVCGSQGQLFGEETITGTPGSGRLLCRACLLRNDSQLGMIPNKPGERQGQRS